MKAFLFLILGLAFCQISMAQEILWEKKMGWIWDDQFYDGAQVSEHSIIAIGSSTKFGAIINGNIHNGLIAIKIDIETGDTIWLKNLNQLCYPPHSVKGVNGFTYIVAPESITPYRLRLTILDTNGNIFFRRTLDSSGEAPNIQKLIRTKDSNFIAIGSQRGFGPNITVDMYAIKFDWLGNVIWNQRYNGNPNSGGNHIEEIPGNQFLLSGNAGSRIWRIKIDSAGNVLEDNFLYQTPSLVNFDQNTSVLLTPDSANSVSGTMSGSSQKYYFGKHKNIGNSKIWGGQQAGYMAKSMVNQDRSIIQYRANNAIFHLNRLYGDSSIIWSTDMSNRLGSRSVILNKFIYLEDQSAIALGFLFYLTSISNEFYFCRISNVGVPYDPIVISNKEILKGESLLPFPNPSSGSLVFKGLKEDGQLQLYNVKGQMVKELGVKPNQQIHVGDLVSGLYLYRIQTKTRFFSGKVVKN